MRLVVIRHAKAGEAPSDIERPLTGRGRRDAAAIGKWLRAVDIAPDRVVVSPAVRAQQTWQHAAGPLAKTPEPVIDDRIYANEVELLRDVVRETAADVGTLVLVGHNPSFGAFALDLDDGEGDSQARRDLLAGFPTSAVAVFDLAGPWTDARPRAGRLTAFAAPRG